MKRTRMIWAAAGMAVVGLVPIACTGSVDIGAQDPACPSVEPEASTPCNLPAKSCAYQEGPCNVTLLCNASALWQSTVVTCMPAATDCASAADGDICKEVGSTCQENQPPCNNLITTSCGFDHHWKQDSAGGGGGCCPASGTCPTVQPHEGDPCTPCPDPKPCTYPGPCGELADICGPDGKWHIPAAKCPSPPPDECAVGNPDQGTCESNPSCRWLVPGCVTSALTAPGCFAAADCSPASCKAGLFCEKVSYNPCFGKGCDACGADTLVCLPAIGL